MTRDDVIEVLGEIIYESSDAKEIFDKAFEYGKRYNADMKNNINYGIVCLNGAYAAFMRGYETKKVCEVICLFINQGIPLIGFDEIREENLKNAIAQYGTKNFNSGQCADILYFSYTNGAEGYIKANKTQSRKWLEKSAALGTAEAQLGLAYELHHEGKVYDAEEWYLAAAKQGNTEAMYRLAVLYESRFFSDWDKAGYWFAEAASRGEQQAERTLKNNYYYNERQQKWMKRM